MKFRLYIQFLLFLTLLLGSGVVHAVQLPDRLQNQSTPEELFYEAEVLASSRVSDPDDQRKREEIAVGCLKLAAEREHRPAQSMLGMWYRKGFLVKRDDYQARLLFQQAAANNDPIAPFYVGSMYDEGLFGRENIDQAYYWMKQSADRGYAPALYWLAVYHQIRQEKDKQKMCLLSSAVQGHVPAQIDLGFLFYDEGQKNEAFLWWECAAFSGDPAALNELGYYYYVWEKNLEIAKKYFIESFQEGHLPACFNIALVSYVQYLETSQCSSLNDAIAACIQSYDLGDVGVSAFLAYMSLQGHYDDLKSFFHRSIGHHQLFEEGFKQLISSQGASFIRDKNERNRIRKRAQQTLDRLVVYDEQQSSNSFEENTEKLAAEKLAAEKLAAEKLAAEQLAAEKLAAEQLAAEQLAAEKLAAKKLAAEKKAKIETIEDIIKQAKQHLKDKQSDEAKKLLLPIALTSEEALLLLREYFLQESITSSDPDELKIIVQAITKLAESGNIQARLKLAAWCLTDSKPGISISQDVDTIYEWLKLLEKDKDCECEVFRLLAKLHGNKNFGNYYDPEKARDYWKKAAMAGSQEAMIHLIELCASGKHSENNPDFLAKWIDVYLEKGKKNIPVKLLRKVADQFLKRTKNRTQNKQRAKKCLWLLVNGYKEAMEAAFALLQVDLLLKQAEAKEQEPKLFADLMQNVCPDSVYAALELWKLFVQRIGKADRAQHKQAMLDPSAYHVFLQQCAGDIPFKRYLHFLSYAAGHKDPEALYLLGKAIQKGIYGFKKDEKKCRYFFAEAVRKNHPLATLAFVDRCIDNALFYFDAKRDEWKKQFDSAVQVLCLVSKHVENKNRLKDFADKFAKMARICLEENHLDYAVTMLTKVISNPKFSSSTSLAEQCSSIAITSIEQLLFNEESAKNILDKRLLNLCAHAAHHGDKSAKDNFNVLIIAIDTLVKQKRQWDKAKQLCEWFIENEVEINDEKRISIVKRRLAFMLCTGGCGIEANQEEGAKLYEYLATSGFANEVYSYSVLLCHGIGTEQNVASAAYIVELVLKNMDCKPKESSVTYLTPFFFLHNEQKQEPNSAVAVDCILAAILYMKNDEAKAKWLQYALNDLRKIVNNRCHNQNENRQGIMSMLEQVKRLQNVIDELDKGGKDKKTILWYLWMMERIRQKDSKKYDMVFQNALSLWNDDNKDYAVSIFQELAKCDYVPACYQLTLIYISRYDSFLTSQQVSDTTVLREKIDQMKSVIKLPVKENYKDSIVLLGAIYYLSNEWDKAANYWTEGMQSSDQGVVNTSKYNLALILAKGGNGLPADPQKAKTLLTHFPEGFYGVLYHQAIFLTLGIGTQVSPEQAADLFDKLSKAESYKLSSIDIPPFFFEERKNEPNYAMVCGQFRDVFDHMKCKEAKICLAHFLIENLNTIYFKETKKDSVDRQQTSVIKQEIEKFTEINYSKDGDEESNKDVNMIKELLKTANSAELKKVIPSLLEKVQKKSDPLLINVLHEVAIISSEKHKDSDFAISILECLTLLNNIPSVYALAQLLTIKIDNEGRDDKKKLVRVLMLFKQTAMEGYQFSNLFVGTTHKRLGNCLEAKKIFDQGMQSNDKDEKTLATVECVMLLFQGGHGVQKNLKKGRRLLENLLEELQENEGSVYIEYIHYYLGLLSCFGIGGAKDSEKAGNCFFQVFADDSFQVNTKLLGLFHFESKKANPNYLSAVKDIGKAIKIIPLKECKLRILKLAQIELQKLQDGPKILSRKQPRRSRRKGKKKQKDTGPGAALEFIEKKIKEVEK